MSLLRDIQAAAIDGSTDLEILLRKCRVLAARLKNEEFRQWVENELNGYKNDQKIPDYRKYHGHCIGHFLGPFGSGLRNAPIPQASIPAEIRDRLTKVNFHQSVSSLQNLVDDCKTGSLRQDWPADANALFGQEIYDGMVLGQAWLQIPKNMVVGILSTVRNRILSFVLEIEASNPDAGEALPGSTPVPTKEVSQVFYTTIHGNVGNIASGHGNTQTATVNVHRSDLRSLLHFLKDQGVTQPDIDELEAAVKSDPAPTENGFGKGVSQWIGKMTTKALSGAWDISKDIASKVLLEAVNQYYGLKP